MKSPLWKELDYIMPHLFRKQSTKAICHCCYSWGSCWSFCSTECNTSLVATVWNKQKNYLINGGTQVFFCSLLLWQEQEQNVANDPVTQSIDFGFLIEGSSLIVNFNLMDSPYFLEVYKMLKFCYFFLQSPRNGEDLSDAENNSHDEGARESASPEDGHGQVRVKVRKQNWNCEKFTESWQKNWKVVKNYLRSSWESRKLRIL